VAEVKLEIEEDLSHFAEKGLLKIGVPKEIFPGEKRVAIVPQTVRKLVKSFITNYPLNYIAI